VNINIKTANNGFIMTTFDERQEEGHQEEVSVYHNNNMDDFIELLCDISELIGPQSSRYSKERILIQVTHGNKYECSDKECMICFKG